MNSTVNLTTDPHFLKEDSNYLSTFSNEELRIKYDKQQSTKQTCVETICKLKKINKFYGGINFSTRMCVYF